MNEPLSSKKKVSLAELEYAAEHNALRGGMDLADVASVAVSDIVRLTSRVAELEIDNGEKAEEIQKLTVAHEGEMAAHHRTLDSWQGKVEEIARLRAALTELHRIADSGESDIRAIGPVIDRFPELRQPVETTAEHPLDEWLKPVARPVAWWRPGPNGEPPIFASGNWPPPEPDDTAWRALYDHPQR